VEFTELPTGSFADAGLTNKVLVRGGLHPAVATKAGLKSRSLHETINLK